MIKMQFHKAAYNLKTTLPDIDKDCHWLWKILILKLKKDQKLAL
jgi:hypothetical protein